MARPQPYPLYDSLLKSLDPKATIDIQSICSTINGMTSIDANAALSHGEEIVALIYHHRLLEGGVGNTLYKSKPIIGNKGFICEITSLPTILQRIIAEYVLRYS